MASAVSTGVPPGAGAEGGASETVSGGVGNAGVTVAAGCAAAISTSSFGPVVEIPGAAPEVAIPVAAASIAIGTHAATGVLAGTTTETAVDGIATFSNLSINMADPDYTLTATAGDYAGATSLPFDIVAGRIARQGFSRAGWSG